MMLKVYPKILLIIIIACQLSCGDKNRKLTIEKQAFKLVTKTESVYDSLKQLDNSKIEKWYKLQDSLAEDYFEKDSTYHEFLKIFNESDMTSDSHNTYLTINEKQEYYYVHEDTSGIQQIYFQESFKSEPQVLFNLKDLSSNPINYLSTSYDGSMVAIGFSNEDGFSSTIYFYDTNKKKVLNDKIKNINPDYGGLEWLPDNSGVIYLYFPETNKNSNGFKKNSFSALHKFGNANTLKPVFGNTNTTPISPDFYPKIKIASSSDTHAIGYEASSNDFYNSYIISIEDLLEGVGDWKPFFKISDSVYYNQGVIKDSTYYYRSNIEGNTALCSVNIVHPNFNEPEILALGNDQNQLVRFEVCKNKIYYTLSKYGSNIKLFELKDNQTSQIDLPFIPGYLKFFGGSVNHNFIAIGIDGWLSNYKRYVISSSEGIVSENIQQGSDYPEFNTFKVTDHLATSHDGEKIPLTLITDSQYKREAPREVLLYVYGAYGESIEPFFEPMLLEWIKQGGILAFAHVRGGGEKGKRWHLQGQKQTKYNSWKDLNACSEYLIKNKITSEGLISILTSSAGGITAGMAINEKPQLYSSFIADVPRLNPYELEKSYGTSSTSYLEYGSIKDSIENVGLRAMDPFLNIQRKHTYPAVLIMSSYLDDRIPLWDSGKYISKIADSMEIKRPVLLDIDYKSGHEDYGSPYSIFYSRVLSFAKKNMRR